MFEHRHRIGVRTVVGTEAEVQIGFDGVEAFVLQIVGFKFVDKPYAAPFLT